MDSADVLSSVGLSKHQTNEQTTRHLLRFALATESICTGALIFLSQNFFFFFATKESKIGAGAEVIGLVLDCKTITQLTLDAR